MNHHDGIYTDLNALSQLKLGARQNSPQAIKQVAKQFESLLIQMMLKSMRDTLPENTLFGSRAERMYQDMHDKQLSLQIANSRGIGLARVIERQLGGQQQSQQNDSSSNLMDSLRRLPFSAAASQAAINRAALNPASINPPPQSPAPTAANGARNQAVKVAGLPRSETGSIRPDAEPALNKSAQKKSSGWHSIEQFVDDLWPHALQASRVLGVGVDVLLAQSALETGWGKFLPQRADGSNSFNLFGIKAGGNWQGDSVEINTREYRHGVMQQEQSRFRAYDSVADSFKDYTRFIQNNPRYRRALEHGYDPSAYARELQKAGYATDPNYARKINRVRHNPVLQQRIQQLDLSQSSHRGVKDA